MTDHPGGHPGRSPGLLAADQPLGPQMQTADPAEVQRKFKELQKEHRRALAEGDIEALNRIQSQLAELMKQAGTRGGS